MPEKFWLDLRITSPTRFEDKTNKCLLCNRGQLSHFFNEAILMFLRKFYENSRGAKSS